MQTGISGYCGVLLLFPFALGFFPFLGLLAFLALLGFALLARLGCPLSLHHVLYFAQYSSSACTPNHHHVLYHAQESITVCTVKACPRLNCIHTQSMRQRAYSLQKAQMCHVAECAF